MLINLTDLNPSQTSPFLTIRVPFWLTVINSFLRIKMVFILVNHFWKSIYFFSHQAQKYNYGIALFNVGFALWERDRLALSRLGNER